ncbi:MAG: response regulator [Selenomonadaceae bacterium]|nr:response regulator [Selenomonadaceae bacterium]
MIQKTYKITSKADFVTWLADLKCSDEYNNAHSVLIKGLTAQFMDYDISEAHDTIVKTLPKAKAIGMSLTSFGRKNFKKVINATRYFERYMMVSCCFFDKSEVNILECGNDMLESGEVTIYLRNKLSKIPDIKAVEVLSTGKSRYISSLIEDISIGYEDVPFFGAEAGFVEMNKNVSCSYHDFQNKFTTQGALQYIHGEKMYTDGILLVVYSGKDLQVYSNYHLGWKPLGKEMKITKAVGSTCIATIDNIPAVHIYKKYLNVEPDDFFLMNICEFPMIIKRNNCNIARIPPMYDEQGWLYFGADVHEGEKLQLSYGNPQEVLAETWQTSEQMRQFGPEAIFLYICGSRNIFLNEMAHFEVEYYTRFCPNATSCYGNGEIYRYKNQGGMLNGALISIGMRESAEPLMLSCSEETASMYPYQNQSHALPLVDRLAAFLEATTDELKDLIKVVSESNHKLRKMAKEAESANKAKSQFLSNMSHEIRTPINAILGMNEMILREGKDETILEYAESIRTASNSLLGLVNDILDFSKIEAGKMEIIPVEYAMSSLLNDLVNMIQKRADDKDLQFIVSADENLPTVLFGDEIRIKQIITNILTNAVKYTEKGSVTLSASFTKKSDDTAALKFSIKDTGIGIKQEDIAKLFSAFERIEEKRNRAIEGTGLGMNITQRLLNMMDSKLEVDSVYGKGSTFSFTIEQKVMNWEPIGDFEENYRRSLKQHQEYHEKFTAPKARILVVDDTVMNLTVVKGLLKQTQIQIYTAESGYECLHLVTKEKYDIIFLDHRMPGIDGIETLQQMKKLPNNLNKDTPVISLTANAVSGARAQYMEAGFQDYLTKPINSSALETMIIKYLPKDKVIISDSIEDNTPNEAANLPEWLTKIEGLNTAEGINHCGGVEPYLDALTVFAESVSSGVKEIAGYFEAEDWKSYTTKVHALKSSARVIGAAELSERARRLEDAGNSNYINEIKECTAPLLELYLSYAAKLAPLCKVEDDNADKPLIDDDALAEAYETMREVAASFDYDSLVFVFQSLDDYRLPDSEVERYKALKNAAAKLDWDKINSLLNNAA